MNIIKFSQIKTEVVPSQNYVQCTYIISSHNKEKKIYGGCCGVKADWVVSMEKVLQIHSKTGIVVPIGSRKYTFLLVTIVINMA